ncbi:MAG: hypothetical protein IPI48_18085 [bacterium]|nr:hypothetical protein [bacterium]
MQVHSPGYRNAYDVVLTQGGRLYTFDNGPNGGWGGLPVNEGTVNVTNESNEAGDTGYGDQLQFISGQGFYGGHPNPTRANPTGSDIFTYQKISGTWTLTGAYDWLADFPAPPVPAALANPAEGTYLVPGADGSLFTVGASTNGICEYTAGNFGGQMTGQLLAASFNGNVIRFKLNGAGTTVLESANVGNLATPLDVTAQGDFAVFPGTIWSADHGSSTISVYEPVDFGGGGGACTGANVSNLDEDNDGFSNADEIANGTNPCASGSFPADADGDQLSDLIDPDDDNDGLPDTSDPFAIDPDNGLTTGLPVNYTFSINAGDQVPGTFLRAGLHRPDEQRRHRLPGPVRHGQTGRRRRCRLLHGRGRADRRCVPGRQQPAVRVPVRDRGGHEQPAVHGPHAPAAAVLRRRDANQPPVVRLQLGTGHQDNYLKIVLTANGGAGGVQVLLEQAGVATEATYGVGVTGNVLAAGTVDLYADVNPAAATVQRACPSTAAPRSSTWAHRWPSRRPGWRRPTTAGWRWGSSPRRSVRRHRSTRPGT